MEKNRFAKAERFFLYTGFDFAFAEKKLAARLVEDGSFWDFG